MKTNAPKVEHEEALTLADWVESHAHAEECDDDHEEWVYKCTRIAEALKQLAALRKTPKSSTGSSGLCNEVFLPKVERHSWSFDKDLVYDCGPRC